MAANEKRPIGVFLVEDEAVILESYRAILESGGYRITGCAYTGRQALLEIPKTKTDIVLLDINLPDIDGFSVLETLSQTVAVPCVFVTGFFNEELIRQATQLGAFGYVIKPIEEKQLFATLQVAFSRANEFSILREESKSVKEALDNRKFIERAKGILMERQSLSEEEAMRTLQRKSNQMNKKLVEVAKEIIQAEKYFF